MTSARRLLHCLQGSRVAQTGIVFLLLLVLKGGTLTDPPVWDAAFSVFSAAAELVSNGFDLLALSQMPTYHDGGPNAHALSIVTLVTAAVLALFEAPPLSFVVLHVIHLAIAALGLAVFWRLSACALGFQTAAGLTMVVLLQPSFSVQVGFLYVEIPTFVCSMLAISAWARAKLTQALFWVVVAGLIKETGLIVAAALLIALLIETKPLRQRIVHAGWMALAPLPGLFLSTFLGPAVGSNVERFFQFRLVGQWGEYFVFNLQRYLLTTPDLLLLIVASLSVIIVRMAGLRYRIGCDEAKGGRLEGESIASRFRFVSTLYILMFLGFFYIAMPIVADYFQVLVRYHVIVTPFMFFLVLDALGKRFGESLLLGSLVLLCLLFAANRNGSLYPEIPDRFGNDFSIVERSGEYTALLKLQRDAIDQIQALDSRVPVFYELPIHFLVSRPGLGYIEEPLANGHSIYTEEPYRHGRLLDFPQCFYMLYLSPWLGGIQIREVENAALRFPSYEVETIAALERGSHAGRVIRVRAKGVACPPPLTESSEDRD
jgi:hypothetical protein